MHSFFVITIFRDLTSF